MDKVIIHGGGYVGLTGAIHLALKGFQVVIYDPDKHTVDTINAGQPRAGEYLGYIDVNVSVLVKDNKLKATTDYESVCHEKIHLLAVPTEKGDDPYMDIVKSCIIDLHATIPHGGLIIVESTLQPGTIDSLYLPRVYKKDIHLAVCPRLDWFGDKEKNVETLPRIIGGVNEESTLEAYSLLKHICKDCRLTRHGVAEFAKAGQNALYFVQIMAAHQLAEEFQDKEDMNEVLKLIGVHWRLPQLFLGPGTSGRCVAMGAKYLTQDPELEYGNLFLHALAYDRKWREKIGDTLIRNMMTGSSSKILVMGIAYRPEFSDFGYSAGLDIYKYLVDIGYNAYIHDPIIPNSTLEKLGKVGSVHGDYDGILLATGHSAYASLPEQIDYKKNCVILDASGLWEKYRERFKAYHVKYMRVGEQNWLN